MMKREKVLVRMLLDFPPDNLYIGDVIVADKWINDKGVVKFFWYKGNTYRPNQVREIPIDTKRYKFKVTIGPIESGTLYTEKMYEFGNSVDEAYNAMMDIVGHRLAKAFPELDIPYSIELVEESEDA